VVPATRLLPCQSRPPDPPPGLLPTFLRFRLTAVRPLARLIFVTDIFAPILFNGQPYVAPAEPVVPTWEPEPHCYACGRHTDHTGEHDTLVALGAVVYRAGEVRLTEFGRWAKSEPGLWAMFYDIEYREYRKAMG
jgi:hypothetical protein